MPRVRRSTLIRPLTRGVLLWTLLLPMTAMAETALFEIHHLPLHEAREIVSSQLSESGSITSLPSRNILVVNDDPGHVEQAKQLLKRLDVAAKQYSTSLELFSLSDEQARSIKTDARLPGGWIRVSLQEGGHHLSSSKRFNLRLTSNRQGTIESGTVRPYQQHTRVWLAGYGVINTHSVEQVPVTSGFYATVRPAGNGMVTVRIVPWMRSQRAFDNIRQNSEIVIGRGSGMASSPATAADQPIEIAGAATEVTISIGETVTIAASSQEAELLGDAILSSGSATGKKSFAIRLRVDSR